MEVAELRKMYGGCQAETNRRPRAETNRRRQAKKDKWRRRKIKRGWETGTGRYCIYILHLQSQLHFVLYIPWYYYFALRLLYLAFSSYNHQVLSIFAFSTPLISSILLFLPSPKPSLELIMPSTWVAKSRAVNLCGGCEGRKAQQNLQPLALPPLSMQTTRSQVSQGQNPPSKNLVLKCQITIMRPKNPSCQYNIALIQEWQTWMKFGNNM